MGVRGRRGSPEWEGGREPKRLQAGGKEDWSHHGKRGGGWISFALVTTDHKNTKGRKEENKKERRGED